MPFGMVSKVGRGMGVVDGGGDRQRKGAVNTRPFVARTIGLCFVLEGAQRVHIFAKLKTGLSAHRHTQSHTYTDRQSDRQTDKSENSISASLTSFTWRI